MTYESNFYDAQIEKLSKQPMKDENGFYTKAHLKIEALKRAKGVILAYEAREAMALERAKQLPKQTVKKITK